MDEAEFGVDDISEEDYNRLRKEEYMAKKKKKKGKKKMKAIGRVEVPNEAFVSALRLDD